MIAKVESHDSVPNIEEIVEASDAVMVARGDLGKEPPPPVSDSTGFSACCDLIVESMSWKFAAVCDC